MITYNHELFIKEAIEGVLTQKCNFPIELVIGDDFSNDNTRNICQEFKTKYSEIIQLLVPGSNLGIMANFRATLQACTGKYIALCEGDDYWTDPYKLQKQVGLLESNPDCSMCVAKTEVKENGQLLRIMGEGRKEMYGFKDILYGTYFHTSTYLIKKEYIDLYLKADCTLFFGDTSLRYFLSDLGPFVLLNDVVSVYRITGNGVWTSLDETKKLKLHIKLHNIFFLKFKQEYRNDFSSILIREHFELLRFSIEKGSLKEIILPFSGLILGLLRNPKYFISFFGHKFASLITKGKHKLNL